MICQWCCGSGIDELSESSNKNTCPLCDGSGVME